MNSLYMFIAFILGFIMGKYWEQLRPIGKKMNRDNILYGILAILIGIIGLVDINLLFAMSIGMGAGWVSIGSLTE